MLLTTYLLTDKPNGCLAVAALGVQLLETPLHWYALMQQPQIVCALAMYKYTLAIAKGHIWIRILVWKHKCGVNLISK